MVRLSWLLAACVATVAAGVAHAESESEAARVRVVMRVHEHGKSVSDTLGDVWDSVKNETSDAIESVADELHDALYGSGSDEEEEPVEIVVVKQTVRKHKVVDTKTTVRHFKTDGEDLLDELEEAIFGSSSTSGSGSGHHEATEVGDEEEAEENEEGSTEESASEEGEEEEEEDEIIDIKTPPPVKKHHKKKHHKATKHHQAKKEEVKTVQKETATMAKATDSVADRRPRETTFVLIGAAVGAMVGIVALAVFVTVRRRRAASSASVLATHESDVEAIAQAEEDEEDVEDAAAPEAEDLEKGDKKDDVKLEGSI